LGSASIYYALPQAIQALALRCAAAYGAEARPLKLRPLLERRPTHDLVPCARFMWLEPLHQMTCAIAAGRARATKPARSQRLLAAAVMQQNTCAAGLMQDGGGCTGQAHLCRRCRAPGPCRRMTRSPPRASTAVPAPNLRSICSLQAASLESKHSNFAVINSAMGSANVQFKKEAVVALVRGQGHALVMALPAAVY